MQRIDDFFLKFSALIIIVSAVFYNMTLEHLLEHGYSSPSVLLYRGILTFTITVVLSLKGRKRIIPQNIHLQWIRIVNSGVALLLVFQSFKYLEATSVSMVQRLDIPFAVLIGFMTGQRKNDFRVGLSVFACCLVLSIFFFAEHIGEKPLGLVLALIAVLQVSIAYLLVKKSIGVENNFVIVNTTNIGCILVGIISGLIFGNLNMVRIQDLWIFFIASITQFLLNYTGSILYRHSDVAIVQRPYLISVLVILIVEQIWDHRLFDLHHSGIIILVIAVIYLITLKQSPGKKQIAWIKNKMAKKETNQLLN